MVQLLKHGASIFLALAAFALASPVVDQPARASPAVNRAEVRAASDEGPCSLLSARQDSEVVCNAKVASDAVACFDACRDDSCIFGW
ncbi:hypothetical protein DHEL01_v211466 [Diaporthe helianthi]|uniref:Uncharacterized protein n=1 Tax=Diaporthe helianthi TaxID=158607 RepID=A0A2P5HIR5_DIAHE|nr:hypothetical protein DHEL01_v211466 [Diaporthe helianthi]